MVKFTKASKRDNDLVTVSLKQFTENTSDLYAGTLLAVNVENVETLFTVNRSGRTATTRSFPRRLRLPSVGKPVVYNVRSVRILND